MSSQPPARPQLVSSTAHSDPATGPDVVRPSADVIIAGAGIVGLSLALELDRRGARVTVLEAAGAMQQSSSAAAGMLAVHDPHNPAVLLPLARLSEALYPAFLQRIEALSGVAVPFQTDNTLQYLQDGSTRLLVEHSIDPRQLAHAMLTALRATRIDLREHTALERSEVRPGGITAVTAQGDRFPATHLVYATGAWATGAWATGAWAKGAWAAEATVNTRNPVTPRKGQMLRVQLSGHVPLLQVHRSEAVYVVPRRFGPQAGTALIGATVEEAGFDTSTHAEDLTRLRELASHLVPELADPLVTPAVEAWAGLRPGTPDQLPLLGALQPLPAGAEADSSADIVSSAELIATGHFRNGILLAPATAAVLADLIETGRSDLDLSPFAPLRFAGTHGRRAPF